MEIIQKVYGYVPDWAWEIETVLRVHGPMTNKDIADLIGRPAQRTHEVIAKMHSCSAVIKERTGKEVYVKLPVHF